MVNPSITTHVSCNSVFIQTAREREALQLTHVLEVRTTVSQGLRCSFAIPDVVGQNSLSQHSNTEEAGSASKHADDEAGKRSPSLRSLPTEPNGQDKFVSGMRTTFGSVMTRKGSVRTARSTHTTGTTSAFANGAPLTRPDADPDVDESFFARGDKAERSLSQKQKDRIAREESGSAI